DAGSTHSCAVLANGTAKCWGANISGELGDGTTAEAHTPVVVSGLTNAVAISVGWMYSCALLADGTAKCWGFNQLGQLGDGTTSDAHTPVVVSGFNAGTNAVAITAGSSHYS